MGRWEFGKLCYYYYYYYYYYYWERSLSKLNFWGSKFYNLGLRLNFRGLFRKWHFLKLNIGMKLRDLIILQTKLWKFGVSKEYLKIGIQNNN